MEKLADRILIYIFLISFSYVSGISMAMVIAMLISIIMVSLGAFFDNRNVTFIFHVVYVILSMAYPEFTGFMPIAIYSCICRREYYLAALYALPFFKYVLDMPYIILLLAVSIYLGIRMNSLDYKNGRILRFQERNLELEALLKKKQAEMAAHQEYEIRMAMLNERNRIAREIHDNVGHMLSRSILQAGAIQTVNQCEELKEPLRQLQGTLDTAMSSIRESVHDLKDEAVDLKLTVDGIIREYEHLSVSFDYDVDGDIPKKLKYCFLAVIKEALTNVTKHSNASKVVIVIREHPALYQLLIFDNGSIKPEISGDGIGLENIRERVGAFDGIVRFAYENGFKIFVSVKKNDGME